MELEEPVSEERTTYVGITKKENVTAVEEAINGLEIKMVYKTGDLNGRVGIYMNGPRALLAFFSDATSNLFESIQEEKSVHVSWWK